MPDFITKKEICERYGWAELPGWFRAALGARHVFEDGSRRRIAHVGNINKRCLIHQGELEYLEREGVFSHEGVAA